tara:strand:- start:394 stop:1608 length:1215 start_codon:yes stop_codon:yes gene_type:complete
MAHYHWQKSRKTYKLSYTIYIGGTKRRKNKYSTDRSRIDDLLAATGELETAARTGIAPTEAIYRWVERKFIKAEEAQALFPGYYEAAERAGLLTAATDYEQLRRAYRKYCERNHTRGKSGYDGWYRGDKVISWLKTKNVGELSENDCEEFVQQILSNNSTQTAGHYLTTLRIILDEAVKLRMIKNNPARSIDKPVIDDASERSILTPDQIQWVKDSSLKPEHSSLLCGGIATAVRLGLYGGLRNGEMSWLRWSRINIDNGTVHIAKTKTSGNDEWVPKDYQDRVVDLKADCIQYLRELKKTALNGQKDGFVLRSNPKNPNASRGDGPIYPGALSKAFNAFMRREDRYGEFTIYSFRHTYATSLLRSGVDIRTVQHLMGHENISTTQKYLRPLRAEEHPSDALEY